MNISYNWLKKFVDVDYSPEELDHILTMLGIEVESIADYGKKYDKFVTAVVLHKEKHPNADKLSVCRVSTGTEERTVVCGAPNVEAGQSVVLGLPGAVVPQSGIKLEKRAVRKIESDGMICSQTELEMGEDHSGIWVLPENTPPGQALSDYLGLNDTIFEISVTPNRADCLSHLGIARDIAAYARKQVTMPEININETGLPIVNSVRVVIEDTEKCPRYTARVVRDVTIGESPEWLKRTLVNLGLRPINIAVDVTNYVLYECGQPLHAFDLGKIKGGKVIIKTAAEGSKFTTLDSKERQLDSQMLMICDADKPIAIGGVMGGENSEITTETRDILIESAYFNPSSIRRTAKKLGLTSDAAYRFERGVDIDNITFALDRAAQLIAEIAGGSVEMGLIDEYPVKKTQPLIKLRYEKARKIIGIDVSAADIKDMLLALKFVLVSEDDGSLTVQPPSFRVDIAIEVDVIEEIARLYNYDNIQADFSTEINFTSESVPEQLAVPPMRLELRDYLVRNGYHEIVTQNITDPVSAKLFEEDVIQIANPLGEELSVMRTSLIPSIMRVVERNHRLGSVDLRLFEIGKTFHKVDESTKTFIPGFLENEELIIVMTGRTASKQWGIADRPVDFYDIKGVFEDMMAFFRFDNIELERPESTGGHFSKNMLTVMHKGRAIGSVGSISKDLLKRYDVGHEVYIALIDLSRLYSIKQRKAYYSLVSPYPGSSRDLAFMVPVEAQAGEILKDIKANGGSYLQSVGIFDVYAGKSIEPGKKSIAFSLFFSSPDRTLVEEEVETALSKIVSSVENKFAATLRKV